MNPIPALLRAFSPALRRLSHTMSVSHTEYLPHLVPDGGINRAVERAEYAVRGALVARAQSLRAKLSAGENFPFDRIVFCNIGNPQSLQQKPLTVIRQTLAAAVYPALLDMHGAGIPDDVRRRVDGLMTECHGVGAYSNSKGIAAIRERVADAIAKRDDGVPSNPECIYLTNGASEGVKLMIAMLIRSSNDGVLIPIPQYPLYSATMTLTQGTQVGYYLDEDNAWALNLTQLSRALTEARENGTNVRAIVVINPGNPTGQTLTRKNMEELVRFCEAERLMILADEVYQTNVYVKEKPFVSFKKVVAELNSSVELASFHSTSKGFIGECGLRGGYMETYNVSEHGNAMVYKMMSVSLCANIPGQIAVDIMMTPPKEGEESYALYREESDAIYNSLKGRAQKLSKALNSFEGVQCNPSEGAMYLFPKITLPEKAVAEAKKQGYAHADVFYCMELLEATGVCVVPGSGFGQKPGTLHFRTTFLPPEDQIEHVVEKMREFHGEFLKKFT